MALNPNTLYHLYRNGILDYVPGDLAMPAPVGIFTPVANPYLDMAKQGGLYQSAGMGFDSFQSSCGYNNQAHNSQHNYGASVGQTGISSTYNYGGNGYNGNIPTGAFSNTGVVGMLNGYGVGEYNNNGISSMLGENGSIGTMSQTGGINSLTGIGIGTQNNQGAFSDVQNGISSGVSKTLNVVNSTPRIILGTIAAIIGGSAIVLAFKGRKKPPKTGGGNTSFWSKLNPFNWNIFRKNK